MKSVGRFFGLCFLVSMPLVCLAEAAEEAVKLTAPKVICRATDMDINRALAQYAPDSFEISALAQSHGAAAFGKQTLSEKTICVAVKPVAK